MPIFKKAFPPIIGLILLGLVIYYVTPPKSLVEASFFQLVAFFGPLFLFIYSAVNLVTKYWLRSLVISIGFILLIVVYLLDSLNLVTAGLILAASVFLVRALKKPDPFQVPRKIPKLSRLAKQR